MIFNGSIPIMDLGAALAFLKYVYVWSLSNANLYEMKVLPGASDEWFFIFGCWQFFTFLLHIKMMYCYLGNE